MMIPDIRFDWNRQFKNTAATEDISDTTSCNVGDIDFKLFTCFQKENSN